MQSQIYAFIQLALRNNPIVWNLIAGWTMIARALGNLFFTAVTLIYTLTVAQVSFAAGTGVKGWGSGQPPLASGEVLWFSDPDSACQDQFSKWTWRDAEGPGRAKDTAGWQWKTCEWTRGPLGGPGGSVTGFECVQGYIALSPGYCIEETQVFPTPDTDDCGGFNSGGNDAPSTANPIDIMSGAKRFRITDFVTADSQLHLERLYNSRPFIGTRDYARLPTVGLGPSWRFAFQNELHLNQDAPDHVEFATAGGGIYSFLRQNGIFEWEHWGRGPYKQTDVTVEFVGTWPSNMNAIFAAPSQWKVRNGRDEVWTFQTFVDSSNGKYRIGRPINVVRRGGATMTFTYGTQGELSSIQDSYGKSFSFTWNYSLISSANGVRPLVVSQVGLTDGTTMKYLYDTAGVTSSTEATRLTKVEHQSSSGSVLNRISYLYANTDFPFAVTGVKDFNDVVRWSVEYDAAGRATVSKGPNDSDKVTVTYGATTGSAATRTVTNALGKAATYNIANLIWDTHLTGVDGTASTNCPASVRSYQYYGNFISSTTDEEGRVTSYLREGRGLPTQIVQGSGTSSAKTTTTIWNSIFRVPTHVVEAGLTTDYVWNTAGQLTSLTQTDTTSQAVPYSTNGQTRVWAYTYDIGGQVLTVDGPLSGTGDTVTYTYTTEGYLATITNEVGHVTTVSARNGRGQPTTISDANGVSSNLTYDAEGRFKSMTVDTGGLAATTTIEYNVVGDITKVTRPNNAYLQYTYDDGRRITKVQDNFGNVVEYDRNALGGATARRIKDASANLLSSQTAVFDELGRLFKFVGASNQTWTHAYDKTDNRVSITDPRSNVFGWTFDALNRLIKTTDEQSSAVTLTRNGKDEITNYSDPRSLGTGFVRNGFGEIIQRTSPDTGTTVFRYNALGKPTQITDGRGVVTNFTYDNAGRLLTKQYPAATTENVTYTWDAITSGNKGKGRVTKIQDASGSIEWIYNVLGQVTQEKKTTGTAVYTLSYAYDLNGNVTQITYPSGRIVNYSRGVTGLVTGVTTKANSSAATVALAGGVAYKPFGPLQTLTYGNGLILFKVFTQDYGIDVQLVEQGSTSIMNRAHGRWNNDFDITNVWDNNVSARSENYVYTPNHRLQNAYGSWGTLTYYQDGVGNRTADIFDNGSTTVSKSLAYAYNNNLLQGFLQGSTVLRTITHDGGGNIITDARGSTTYNYRYNKRGRLDRLTVGSSVKADYSYDGLERMSVRTTQNMTPSGTTHYVYDRAGRLLAESTGTGGAQREYVWIDDMPLAVVADIDTATPKLWYVHPDHLDRPVKMTDASKVVVWDAWYWPYGETRSITGTASLNLRFPGQYYLAESGMHYNWHRHYDPTTGRYIQADPLSDVLATRPVNLDGSALIALGGTTGGAQLASVVASPGDYNGQFGSELPEFIDGPSVYQYARSSPAMFVDPTGQASRAEKIYEIIRFCLSLAGGDIKVPPSINRPMPRISEPSKPPVKPIEPGGKGGPPTPPTPPSPPTPPISR